jgi:hypothetical protein
MRKSITFCETGAFNKISAYPAVRACTNLKPIAAIITQQECAQATGEPTSAS